MPNQIERDVLTVAGRDVAVSNPHKVLFPQTGYTKLDVARYYLAVSDGALRGAGGRPNVLVRYPHGVGKLRAHDRTSGAPVTTFKRSTQLYNVAMSYNRGLDRDKDGIACEKR